MLRRTCALLRGFRSPSSDHTSKATNRASHSSLVATKANKSKSASSLFAKGGHYSLQRLVIGTSPHRINTRVLVSYYNTSTTPQVSTGLQELKNRCGQLCASFSSSLTDSSIPFSEHIDRFKAMTSEYGAKEFEPIITSAVAAIMCPELKISAAERALALDAAVSYYCELQLLLQAEQTLYLALQRTDVQASVETFEKILTLSGRHKQAPSIELAFKTWKKSLGLTYEIAEDELPSLEEEGDAKQSLASDKLAQRDYKRESGAITTFYEYVKDENHERDVIRLFIATIKAAGRAKNLQFAKRVFAESLLVVAQNTASLYDTMVQVFCDANRVEKAHQLLFQMKEREKSIILVLNACARLKNYHLAEKVFHDMQTAFHMVPNISIWNALFGVYVTREEMEIAHTRFVDMLQSKHRIRPDLNTYELLIPGHVRAKDAVRAEEMLKHAKSNKIEISAPLYAWVMEAYLYAKQYDLAYDIVEEMRQHDLALPQKFKNLLLQKSRRVEGLLERYESYFGVAPEPFDDLKYIRAHAEAKREMERRMLEETKNRKKLAKASSAGHTSSEAKVATDNSNIISESRKSKKAIEGEEMENEEEFDNTEFVDVVGGEKEGEYGFLEEIVEDDEEMSREEWMKDDMGEFGWMDFTKPDVVTSKHRRRHIHNVNARYDDVFEIAGWNRDSQDVLGKVKPKEWQIVSDPFSNTRPEVAAKKTEQRRADSQMQALEQEVIEAIGAQTDRAKLKEQRRREKAYGQTRRYTDDPKKIKEEKKRDKRSRPPPGSTFTFR